MLAPVQIVVLPIPAAPGDKGCWRKALPHDRRHHRAQRPEQWPPERRPIPISDRDALKRLVEELHRATRAQREAALDAGRAMLRGAVA
jgi:hypothetical protein